jgi:hypothetical protein
MIQFQLVASYKSIGQYGGVQHLKRTGEERTLCNRDASDYMTVKVAELADIDSAWTCKRCQKAWAALPVA